MKHIAQDQADGLRRMLPSASTQRLLLTGPACDAAFSNNLAAALGALGRTVSMVDGHALLRLTGQGTTMLDIMQGEADILLLTCGGSWDVARAAAAAFLPQADHLLVAFDDAPDAIKQSYLLLKALGSATRQPVPVRVLVTEARGAQSALHMYSNLAATVRQYLGADIAFAGYLPADTHLAMAHTLSKTVVDAFPAAPAALAFRQAAREIASWHATAAQTVATPTDVLPWLRDMASSPNSFPVPAMPIAERID